MMFRLFTNASATKELDSDSVVNNPIQSLLHAQDTDLFQITGPEDGSCVCNDWVGAVVSVSDASHTFPALADAVQDGLFHEGCRHGLEKYCADSGADKRKEHALFCTDLAKQAFAQRCLLREVSHREAFERLYDWARRLDVGGAPKAALIQCDAAWGLLQRHDLFGPQQADVERTLRSRIATMKTALSENH